MKDLFCPERCISLSTAKKICLLPTDEAYRTTCTLIIQKVKRSLNWIEKGGFDNKHMHISVLFLFKVIETEKDKLINNYEEIK